MAACRYVTLSSEAQVERLSMIPSKSEARHLPETGHELRSQPACFARIFPWEVKQGEAIRCSWLV